MSSESNYISSYYFVTLEWKKKWNRLGWSWLMTHEQILFQKQINLSIFNMLKFFRVPTIWDEKDQTKLSIYWDKHKVLLFVFIRYKLNFCYQCESSYIIRKLSWLNERESCHWRSASVGWEGGRDTSEETGVAMDMIRNGNYLML